MSGGKAACVNGNILPLHREQVEKVVPLSDAGRCGLDQCQLLKDAVKLLGLDQVDPALGGVGPFWQGHVHRDQVLQVDAQDGETEALAFGEALAIMAVVPAGRHYIH